jgi:nicotinamide-nucleotide adenylyltransferase
MKTGIFIGRFQPFHFGHLKVVAEMLKEVDRVIIGIGSSQVEGREENPYSAALRREMIEASLANADVPPEKWSIVEIPDINDYPHWPAHVRKCAGPFDALWTGSALVRDLFEMHDKTEIHWITPILKISATEIRAKLKTGETIQGLVPPAVERILTQQN